MAARRAHNPQAAGSTPAPATVTEEFEWRGKRRRPGRPRGSRNRYDVKNVADAVAHQDDGTRVPDIAEMIARQLRIIHRAQETVGQSGTVREITDLSRALDTAVGAVARAARSQDEILARMSQAQQVEAAVRRIEEQDAATVAAVLRRLRARLDDLAERTGPRTAVDAIKTL